MTDRRRFIISAAAKRRVFFGFFAAAALCLSACGVHNGARQAAAGGGIDAGLLTGSIRPDAPPPVAEQAAADGQVILAQFAALQSGGDKSGEWRNPQTGSRGRLALLGGGQGDETGRQCRRFQTTRESFDGVALYKGEACKSAQSPWGLSALREE